MIDIIIPNYNGVALLPTCLDALRHQTRRDFTVTVVDDGSTDGSRELLAKAYAEVRVLALPVNGGFVRAVNAGIAATGGTIVVLLNNDTEATSGWLAALVGALEARPEYDFAASKLLLFDQRDTFHSAGDGYRSDGVPFSRGVWQRDTGQYNQVEAVFGPCAGAAAYRRTALDALAVDGQVFDSDLGMYCEDVDLNLRAWRRGIRTVYVPEAVVYHCLSASGGGMLASYYCGRNFMLVWAKNMPANLVRKTWPALILSQLGFALHSLWHSREQAARLRLKGQFAGLRALPQFIAKRNGGGQGAGVGDRGPAGNNLVDSPALQHRETTYNEHYMNNIELSVVIPAYNEQRRLPETLRQVLHYLEAQSYTSEVIVADDGSSDATADLVEQLAAAHPALRVLRLDHRGKGYAVRAGALAARGNFVLLCDADLATPIEEWEKLSRFFAEGYDLVIGSREGLGAERLGEPWYRHLMGRVFNAVVQVVAIPGIQDTQCGFKALTAAAAQDLFNRVQIYGENAKPVQGAAVTAFDVEVLFIARQRGYRIREVPVIWHYGVETKVDPLRDSYRNFRDVLAVRWYALRGRYPDLHTPVREAVADRATR